VFRQLSWLCLDQLREEFEHAIEAKKGTAPM
jgi:hypothetical protein